MTPDLRAQHDLLLAFKPEGATHDSASCQFCPDAAAAEHQEETTLTEQEIQAMQADLASANAELERMRSEAAAGENEARIQAAVDAAVAPLREELDAAVAQVTTLTADLNAKTAELDELVTANEAEVQAREAAEAAAAVLETRVTAIREVAKFSDEQVEARKAEWAAMDETAFTTMVETLRSTAGARNPIPAVRPSAMTAADGGGSVHGAAAGGALAMALAHKRGLTVPSSEN